MGPLIAAILIFACVFMIVFAISSFMQDLRPERKRAARRMNEEFQRRQREAAKKSALLKNPNSFQQFDSFQDEEPTLSRRQRFERWVEQSGVNIQPTRLLVIAVAVGLASGALALLLTGGSYFIAVLLAVAFGSVPILVISFKRNKRLEKLRSQLPDAFDLMSRVIRAGQTTSQAMQSVADEFHAPIAEEFSYCYEQQNLGLPPELALRDLAQRTGLLEMKIFVLAVMVHRQTGGNLSELLDKLAHVVRDRYRIRGLIRVLTAEGRMQALVLMGLPPGLYVIMLLLRPDYALILLQHPALIAATLSMMTLGALWIRKIITFDF